MVGSISRIILAIAVMAASAQLSFDVNIAEHNIPITGQTLAVLVSAMVLPRVEALIAIALYLVGGGLGLPIFADGSSGWEKLTGNSAGYLWGFLLATFAVSTIRGFRSPRSLASILQGQMLGTVIIIVCGVLVLGYHIGYSLAVELGLLPYWMGAVVKILIGTIITFGFLKINRN